MIPLAMVVIDERREHPSKVALAERRLHDVQSGFVEQPAYIPAPFPITIAD